MDSTKNPSGALSPTTSLVRALLDALASMYYHRDGPWLDELRHAVMNDPDASYIDRVQSAAVIDQFRRSLHPRSDN